jgi:hypothetical protein
MTEKTRTVEIDGEKLTVPVDVRSQLRQLWHTLFTNNFVLNPPLTDAQIAAIVTQKMGKDYPQRHVAVARFRFNRGDYGPKPAVESVAYRGG